MFLNANPGVVNKYITLTHMNIQSLAACFLQNLEKNMQLTVHFYDLICGYGKR